MTQVHHLLYTSSKRFDYAWVRGLQNNGLQNSLEELLIDEMRNTLDLSVSPTLLFCHLHHWILFMGRISKDRRDEHGRIISERMMLLWEPSSAEAMTYGDAAALRAVLLDETEIALRDLPDERNFPPRFRALELDLASLPKVPDRAPLEALRGMTCRELTQAGLSVVLDVGPSFQELLAPFSHYLLNESKVFFGTNFADTLPKQLRSAGSWVFTTSKQEPRGLRDRNGRIVTPSNVSAQRPLERPMPVNAPVQPSAALSTPVADQERSSVDRNGWQDDFRRVVQEVMPGILRQAWKEQMAERATQPVTQSAGTPARLDLLLRQRGWDRYHGLAASYQESQAAWFKQFFSIGQAPIPIDELCKWLIALTLPASFSLPADIASAWTSLLAEIQTSKNPGKSPMAGEWCRRIDTLRILTLQGMEQSDWTRAMVWLCGRLTSAIDPQHSSR